MSITAQSDHPTTLFNTLPISSEPLTINGASWYRTKFARTPPMSTYLLAWVVCDFESTTTNTTTDPKTNVVFSTWASPAQRNATINATQIGALQTVAYEQLFNLPFPLAKQDMIAVGTTSLTHLPLTSSHACTQLYLTSRPYIALQCTDS